tara:strand:- start:48 stop:983 length:936 start_codon:yes stop_codon:yes gene_type:complete
MSKTRKNILTALASKFGVLGDAISSSKELTESEVMAQYVISLLRSGKADMVTDEMLSAADNAYLYKNYDLPMDEASRLARAKDADFVDAYHGTGDNFESVDEGRFGTGIDAYGQGFYSTTATERADRYIPKKPYITGDELDEDLYKEGGNIIPVKVKGGNLFDTNEKAGDSVLKIGKTFEDLPSDFSVEYKDYGKNSLPGVFIKGFVGEGKSTNIKSVFLDPELPKLDVLTKLINTFGKNNSSNILKEAGYDGLISPEGFGEKTFLTFDPKNVRSKYARFDSRLENLKNLSAAVAPIATAGALSQIKGKPQ